MNWSALLYLCLFFLAISCQPVDTTIVGNYTLLKIEEFDSSANERRVSEWMKNGSGTLHYSVTDTMQVEFFPESYNEDSTGRYAYTATYKYFPKRGEIKHTRIAHTSAEEIGKTVKRKLSIQGDTLFMIADEFGLKLTWLKQPIYGRYV